MKNILYVAFVVFFLSFFSCSEEVNISNIPVEITIQRFDRDVQQAAYDTSRLSLLRKHYGLFLEYYSVGLIGIGNSAAPEYAHLLDEFVHSPIVEQAYRKVEETFPDEKKLNDELTLGFKHLSYYFPDMVIPRVYSYVSGFNEAVMLIDSVVGIGLDRFLGDTCVVYDQLDFPKYQQHNMRPTRIPMVCLQSWVDSEYPAEDALNANFLQQMIREGKLLYVTQKCFPKAADTLLFGFTRSQLQWCEKNEASMWEYLLENQLLYINHQFTIQKFVGEAPFTSAFTPEAPGRAVNWLAFRMVKSYMKKNKATMPELMACEAQTLLKEARYNP